MLAAKSNSEGKYEIEVTYPDGVEPARARKGLKPQVAAIMDQLRGKLLAIWRENQDVLLNGSIFPDISINVNVAVASTCDRAIVDDDVVSAIIFLKLSGLDAIRDAVSKDIIAGVRKKSFNVISRDEIKRVIHILLPIFWSALEKGEKMQMPEVIADVDPNVILSALTQLSMLTRLPIQVGNRRI